MIIGICGEAGAGKTTVANYISQNIPEYQVIAFATPLKTLIHSLWGMHSYTQVEKTQVVFDDITVRELMQQVGQAMRKIDPNIWVKAAKRRIDQEPNPKRMFIFDDVRYKNEAAICDYTIKVVRPKNPHKLPDHLNKHESENQLQDYKTNLTLLNNATSRILQKRVQDITDSLDFQHLHSKKD